MAYFFSILIGYLIGSIPFSWMIAKLGGTIDLRLVGSGSMGATNVMRSTKSSKLAALALILDAAKGFLACKLCVAAPPTIILMVGVAAVVGHIFSPFMRFSGGKGVATFAGVLLAIYPLLALTMAIFWVATLFMFRYSSVSSILSIIATCCLSLSFLPWFPSLFLFLIMALILYKHKDNVRRLLDGKEDQLW